MPPKPTLQFNENGFLIPYGPIPTDLDTVKRVFVDAFPNSVSRHPIFEQYEAYNARLAQLMPDGFMQWVDGSFVTKKRDPNDIDLVTFVPFTLYEQHEPFFDELRQLRYLRRTTVDGYFVKAYPFGHPAYHLYNLDRADWNFRFCTPKSKGNKGYLTITS